MTFRASFQEIARIFITLGVFDLGWHWLNSTKAVISIKTAIFLYHREYRRDISGYFRIYQRCKEHALRRE